MEIQSKERKNCCVISNNGVKLQEILAKHIQIQHEGEVCCCNDGLKIKSDLIRLIKVNRISSNHTFMSSILSREESETTTVRLCLMGSKIQETFSEHLRERHADELRIFNELNIPMKFCLCADGKLIQSNLIDHLMENFVVGSPTFEIIQKDLKLEDNLKSESLFEDDFINNRSEEFLLRSSFKLSGKEPKPYFVCESCSYSSPNRNLLHIHWKSEHDPSNEFLCTRKYCRSRFKSQNELDIHFREHEKSSGPTKSSLCHICSKIFVTSTQLNAHLKTHQEKSFCCDICGSKFKTRQEVKVHILRHKGLWQYSKVQRLFPIKTRVKKERIKKIPDELKPYKCEYEGCQRRFKIHSQLNDHINLHLGIKPYSCDYCSETFRAKNGLTTHQKIHTDPYKHWCHHCQRSFSTKNALQDHNDSLHTELLPYGCTYCEQTFRLKKQLLAHIDTHERVTCEICFKSVLVQKYEKHKLKYHSSSSGDKPFKCDHQDCNASFMYSAHLSDHKNVHLNLRPHECEICNEGFNYRSAMLRHRKTHDDPDKFRCTICEKSYASAYSLSLHDRLHASDQSQRPYACSYPECGLTFKFKDHVQKHYRKMHQKAGRVKCELCSKVFFSNYHLNRHKTNVHKEKESAESK